MWILTIVLTIACVDVDIGNRFNMWWTQCGTFFSFCRECQWRVITLTVSVSELEKKLGAEHLNKAYNYLKTARFDDRRLGMDINEKTILHDLSKMVPDADDRFRVEQLLFLEMQINSWVSHKKWRKFFSIILWHFSFFSHIIATFCSLLIAAHLQLW